LFVLALVLAGGADVLAGHEGFMLLGGCATGAQEFTCPEVICVHENYLMFWYSWSTVQMTPP
jgi:hypothetical protein